MCTYLIIDLAPNIAFINVITCCYNLKQLNRHFFLSYLLKLVWLVDYAGLQTVQTLPSALFSRHSHAGKLLWWLCFIKWISALISLF